MGNNIRLFILYYFLFLDTPTAQFLNNYYTFYLETILERFILETIHWIENDANLIFYWILFIILMSLCVRNEYGHDIETLHYIMFSLAMGYFVYLHKEFYPRDTKLMLFKCLVLIFILVQLYWSLILYLWPYTYWLISFQELKTMSLFVWPTLTSTKLLIVKNPISSFSIYFCFTFIYYIHIIR
uniref:hypothetical protein n=1 Tax=Haslea karadagensis TaxID=1146996 RepID=UPI0021FC0F18|nr:hypothetical protein OOD24_mgp07 [Haslea karadagensis]UXN44291.1 hypothetical protein [Haslea karadagensis]